MSTNVDFEFYININNLNNLHNISQCIIHYNKNKNNKNIIKNVKHFLELFDFNINFYKKIISENKNIILNNNKDIIIHFTKNILIDNYSINFSKNISISNDKKILVICENYPGYGGAATNTYNLIKYLKKKNYFVVGIFLNNENDYKLANVDPEKLGFIFNVQLSIFNNHDMLNKLRNTILKFFNGKPSIILNRMIISPLLANILFSDIYTIYYVTGMTQSFPQLNFSKFNMNNIEHKVNRVFGNDIKNLNFYELKSIKYSNKIIFNSEFLKKIFISFYRFTNYKINDKIVNSVFFNKDENINIDDKEFDIILCCSNFLRPEKNNLFVLDLLKNNFLNKKKLFIGNESSIFSKIPNSICLDLIQNYEVISYFKKTKILLFPSLNDSNPSTIVEAYENKCFPIMSKNVGTWNLFPDFLVCEKIDKKEWINKIVYILDNFQNIFTENDFNLNLNSHNNIHILDYIDSFFT